MNDLIAGMIIMGFLTAGLFFVRFWVRSKDRLFLFFATAFWLLAAQRLTFAFVQHGKEDDTIFYVVRLIAFILILVAIWDKNHSSQNE